MNEYIDCDALRQAVLESQHDNPHPRGMAHIAHDCEHAHFVAMIARFPAADVSPVVHGHKVDDGGFYARCSQCDGVLPLCANYCPNCGAKMDGGDNDAGN